MIHQILHFLKNQVILAISIFLLAFTTTRDTKSGYNVTISPYSIETTDLDLDGDMDIIIGHIYHHTTEWSGISTLKNNDKGEFTVDSSYLYGGHTDIIATNINNNPLPDIITQGFIDDTVTIAIIPNYNINNDQIIHIKSHYIPQHISIGDINGDDYKDILFINTVDQIWGIIYNNNDSFGTPEFHNTNYNLQNIACSDIDQDGKDDIVIAGYTEIFFPADNGFDTVLINVVTESIEIIDFDNDDDLDIIGSFGAFVGYTRLHLIENIGNKEFIVHGPIDIQPLCGRYFTISDFNQDQFPDLLLHPYEEENLMILYNNGDFTLSEPQRIPMLNYGESYRRSACADFDDNGYPDIATIRTVGVPIIANVNILFNDGKGNFLDNPISAVYEPDNLFSNLSVFPNPFKKKTYIEVNIKYLDDFKLSIYNINGQLIKNIKKNEMQNNIYHWNATDQNGKEVIPGIYFISLHTGGQVFTQKVVYTH